MSKRVDVAIIGSGFAGSILAWILARQGLQVALMDSATHPRFAIGESSTPIADTILRRLGDTFDLPDLRNLSAWGSWQRTHRDLACGRKRGFSYFLHRKGREFGESRLGENSLLVAASPNDEVADTHWYRSDVDTFLWSRAISAGAIEMTAHEVVSMEEQDDGTFDIHCRGKTNPTLSCERIIDASGQSGVLAKQCAAPDLSSQLLTRTHSVFGHFRSVHGWNAVALTEHLDTSHDPFHPDDAAQHHLLDNGWVWMLRFNHGITSVGYTTKCDQPLQTIDQITRDYPSIGQLMRDAVLVAPQAGLRKTERLQRWFDPVIDSRRIMLPTAAVTLDPLHSTGIAHALAGVERLSRIIGIDNRQEQELQIEQYRRSMMEETQLLDKLVSTAYELIPDFERFTAACMLYFAGAIRCEERYQRGETPSHLWNADDMEFVACVDWSCARLLSGEKDFAEAIRSRLASWNTAGLMDHEVQNRYAYTATKTAAP